MGREIPLKVNAKGNSNSRRGECMEEMTSFLICIQASLSLASPALRLFLCSRKLAPELTLLV